MTKSQLKQIIKECIKEVNETFGTYSGQKKPLTDLYNRIKNDPVVKRNKVHVHLYDDPNVGASHHGISLTHRTLVDFNVEITHDGGNKYEVTVPAYGANQYDFNVPGNERTVTDANGVMRIIYQQIKQELR